MCGGSLCPHCPPSHTPSSAVENPYRVDALVIRNQAKLLQKYLRDEQKELQALYALQALVVKLDQPPSECRGTGGLRRGVADPSPTQQGAWWLGIVRDPLFYPPPRPVADVL